jgi:hypothetical protein
MSDETPLTRSRAALRDCARDMEAALIFAMTPLAIFYLFVLAPFYLIGKLICYKLLDLITKPLRLRKVWITFERACALRADNPDSLVSNSLVIPTVVYDSFTPLILTVWIVLAALVGMGSSLATSALYDPLSALVVWSALLAGIKVGGIIGLMCLLLWLSRTVSTAAEDRLVERAQTLEVERVREGAELAGGLTCATSDEALRGALSGDVAQPGALSEVDP